MTSFQTEPIRTVLAFPRKHVSHHPRRWLMLSPHLAGTEPKLCDDVRLFVGRIPLKHRRRRRLSISFRKMPRNSPRSQLIEQIGPRLNHDSTLIEESCAIVTFQTIRP
jgi:hypothetical protein